MTYTNITARTQTTEHVDFCVADAKGRSVGCAIIRRKLTLVETPEATGGYTVPAGDYIRVEVQTTRGGKLYGATQSGQLFPAAQAAEAEAYAAKRVADSRKAAAKKAGR